MALGTFSLCCKGGERGERHAGFEPLLKLVICNTFKRTHLTSSQSPLARIKSSLTERNLGNRGKHMDYWYQESLNQREDRIARMVCMDKQEGKDTIVQVWDWVIYL